MAKLKELTDLPKHFVSGHSLCGGCGAPIAVRQILMAAGTTPVVCSSATGCLEVSSTSFPFTAWRGGFIHNTFENAAATLAGTEAAFRALKRARKIPQEKEIKFVAFGGDGGTYDIGLQSLSGMLERGHNVLYVCYDNGAYMNTGTQRSGATPYSAWTTTSEVGSSVKGNRTFEKDLMSIVAAHNIPYLAQASISHWSDLIKKSGKALEAKGPAFLNVMAPCPRGWRLPYDQTVEISRLAVQTNYWPLFEVENGIWKLTQNRRPKPVEEFLRPQGRFSHLFRPENHHLIEEFQVSVDRYYAYLLSRVAGSKAYKEELEQKNLPKLSNTELAELYRRREKYDVEIMGAAVQQKPDGKVE